MHIGIVGGGCSGSLLAIHLLQRRDPISVHLIEPRQDLARGLAYSTACPDHLLNVPAWNMSALPAHPTQFVRWLREHGYPHANPEFFAPRQVFGQYIAGQLSAAIQSKPGAFHHHVAEATDIECPSGGAVRLLLSDGKWQSVDRAILAFGNLSPRFPAVPGLSKLANQCYSSAWEEGALEPLGDRPVLLIGSGLTAVDALVALRSRGHRGLVFMVSRHGQVPKAHAGCRPGYLPAAVQAGERLGPALRRMRAAAQSTDWRKVIDGLRPVSNQIWNCLKRSEKQQFRRHLKTYWDVHRHRMAPQIDAVLSQARQAGELEIIAGRLRQVRAHDGCLTVDIALRGGGQRILQVTRVINCTAPDSDYRRMDHALLQSLFRQGFASAGEFGIGLRTGDQGALIDADGRPSDCLFTIGPPRAGDLFESIAVPEIRTQAAALAAHLTAVPAITESW